ncbi:MAG: glycoside hydrolase family 43 protein [Clostridia bacterium]|nr:glycoside hydrolase family 43 protein [Clostridia bacterium]
MKKLFLQLAALFCCLTVLFACGQTPDSAAEQTSAAQTTVGDTVFTPTFDETLTFTNPVKSSETSNLFYNNDAFNEGPLAGDPFLFYHEETGTFYLYGTTRKYSNPGKIEETFEYYTSTDLVNWKNGGVCFQPARGDWCTSRLWAPEVFEIDGKYYMYYTAATGDGGVLHGSVAVADSPAGPFTNEVAPGVDGSKPIFDFGSNFPTIDGSLFIDDDGSMYYYFARDQIGDNSSSGGTNSTRRSTIWGIELENPYTIQAGAKPVKLTEVGRSTVDETGAFTQKWEVQDANAMWNEGPYMLKYNGVYYLTYSANYFGSQYYSIGYAISTDPLSGFTKLPDGEAQIMGISPDSEDNWDYFIGTGHAMFLSIGEEDYIVYHTLMPNTDVWRHFTIDSVGYREDGTLYVNGPTVTAQKVPDAVSELTNVAGKATVSSDNVKEDTLQYLTDGITGAGKAYSDAEAKTNGGVSSLTFTFDAPVELSSIVVYNSADYEQIFTSVARIEIDGLYVIDDVKVLSDSYNKRSKQVYSGSAAILELSHQTKVQTITITFNDSDTVGISEVQILAKG